jgi:DNA-binding transcriptional ArsR family regulator
VVNQFYVYAVDRDFGPFFLKFCSYFPYNAKLCINGHEWAKRQVALAGIGYTALDNGFASCADPAAVQAICDRLGVEQIDGLLRKWLAVLPHPFSPADREAGYRYDISILQAEFSLTQMLDRPVSGRVFFEHVIRDNLDAGRPDQVSLIFDRKLRRTGPRATPGRFRTRVITEGVTPSLHIDYKHTAIKQYHKEGRALRTETTINDTRDFRIGKRLTNLPALREIGLSANRRLLGVQRLSHNPIRAAEAFTAVHEPIITDTGARIAGLRLGDRRAHALLQALLMFRLLPSGFLNRDLRGLLAELLGVDTITAGQMSYDLRRLRAHGLITRIPRSHRYRLTDTGLHHAMLLTHTHTRLLLPGLAQLADPDPPAPSPLRTAARNYRQAIDQLTQDAGLAA